MRLTSLLSVAIVTASLFVGVANAADDTPVRLGAVYGLTGDSSPFDIPSSRGVELFARHANAEGGVLGRQLELVLRDTEGKIDKAAEVTGSLIAEYPDMPAVFGLSESDPVIAAAKVAADDQRIFVPLARPRRNCRARCRPGCSSPASATMSRRRPLPNTLTPG